MLKFSISNQYCKFSYKDTALMRILEIVEAIFSTVVKE